MSKKVKTVSDLKDSALLYDKNPPAFGYMLLLVILGLLIFVVIWSTKTPKVYIITASGNVESKNKTYIMSSYTGEIEKINISEGMNVQTGDALFTVKSADLNLQSQQLTDQKSSYEKKISQYDKLVKSIKDNKNYFDQTNAEDELYYSQYEQYQSQVEQNTIDSTTYKSYGYTDDQIANILQNNQSKITQIYYQAIQTAESSKSDCQVQLNSISAQLNAVDDGKKEYTVTAQTSGKIHMLGSYKQGMVVQAAATIASIAEENGDYNIVAYVGVADAARMKVGNSVDIVANGLSQSIYGTVSGKVTSIDSDMSTNSSSQNGDDSSKSASYFKIKIHPKKTFLISKSGDKVNFTNGMSVESRIKYDKISYFYYVLDALGVYTR